ncbi:LysR family transcriptional regulator [Aquamicrobium lusatiense]|uniref:LysR family transcriptional regulator n=1 Tax=Aquamicrobium lusatiense TaxID=89772 RepID=UPI00245493A5|nr:LysR family transcriptional regulator [Aquamicrobium lusatiense]MDH4989707.1 LysR family transcriptional regulator [Aquamicrobium lusatiense]
MLSITNLRTLIFVADCGGIRPAAERLGRTPSAVSMGLKQLEDAVGSALFEQDRKSHLTKVGEFTVETARDVLKHYDNSCASIRAFARHEVSRCTVASVTSFAGTVLPEAIFRVKSRWTNFEAMVREVHSTRMADTVADGLVDVGFGRITVTRPDVEATPLMHDRYALVCREGHRFVDLGRPIRWEDLADDDFIGNESYDSHTCEGLNRMHDNARFHVSSASSAFALVTARVGVTVLPQLASQIAPRGIRFVPLEDKTASRVVAVYIRRGKKLSPATRMLIETTQALLVEWAADLEITRVRNS